MVENGILVSSAPYSSNEQVSHGEITKTFAVIVVLLLPV